MRTRLVFCALAAAVLLSSCLSFHPNSYGALVGTWTVDTTARADGWHDISYAFSDDRRLTISYDSGADDYVGVVTGVDENAIGVDRISAQTGSERHMVMRYLLDSGATTMQLGWFDGMIPHYYLSLTKM